MQNNQPRRKGFSFLSFFLGILIGIILIVGSVAGVVIYALSADVDSVLSMVGLDNSKNEEGKNQYVNTDKDNGGVGTLLELVQKVGSMVSDTSNLSMGEFENLIPAVSGVVDGLHGALATYVEVEREEFASVKFSQLGEFMQEKILDVQPATLFVNLGMGGMLDNPIMELVFCGAEAEYVENSVSGEKYPAYYDVYVKDADSGKYNRKGDNAELPAAYEGNLVDMHGEQRLYYYFVGETAYITDKDFTFTPPARSANGAVYSLYNAEYSRLSGNYYFKDEEKIEVAPVTLRTLSNGGFDVLDEVYLSELLEGDDALAEKVLGNVSLGDIMNGTVDFDEVLNGLYLSDIMGVKATDKIMARLIYNIADVEPISGEAYAYTGTYIEDGKEIPCFIEVDENKVITCVYTDKEKREETEIHSITVGSLQDGLDVGGLKIGEIMDVSGNMILENLADSTIDGLPDAISKLTINEIYYKEIYKVPAEYEADGETLKTPEKPAELKKAVLSATPASGEITFSEDYLYYTKDNKLVTADPDNLGKLTLAQFAADTAAGIEYYTYGEAQGMWKILLYKTTVKEEKDPDTGEVTTPRESTEGAYSLDKLTDMIANVSDNISETKLYVLHDNGILVFDKRSDLDIGVNYKGKKQNLGDLQLTEALSYLVSVLNDPAIKAILDARS